MNYEDRKVNKTDLDDGGLVLTVRVYDSDIRHIMTDIR